MHRRRRSRQALADTRVGGDAVSIIARLRQVAHVEAGLGRHDSSLQYLDEALALGERNLPETHPLYYNVLLDISGERHARGDLAGALDASSRAYDITQRTLKPGSNDWTGCLLAHLTSLSALDRRDDMVTVLMSACGGRRGTWARSCPSRRQIDQHLKRLHPK